MYICRRQAKEGKKYRAGNKKIYAQIILQTIYGQKLAWNEYKNKHNCQKKPKNVSAIKKLNDTSRIFHNGRIQSCRIIIQESFERGDIFNRDRNTEITLPGILIIREDSIKAGSDKQKLIVTFS